MVMSSDGFRPRQEAIQFEGLPAISPLQHAAESDSPWAQRAYQTYLLVRDAHESPPVDRQVRLARVAAAYDAWVDANTGPGRYFDPDHPTPDQESELHSLQIQADPTTVSVEWALQEVTMTKAELARLLRSGMYGSLSEEEIEVFLSQPRHAWRLDGHEGEQESL